MRKLRYLALSFVIASLMGLPTAFAQETIQPIAPHQNITSTNTLDDEIDRLERELGLLEEENEVLRDENERLRRAQQEIMPISSVDGNEYQPIDAHTNEIPVHTNQDDPYAMQESAYPFLNSEEIEADRAANPTYDQISQYEWLIEEYIAPYEAAQAQELNQQLDDIKEMLDNEANEEDLHEAWVAFIDKLVLYHEGIEAHLRIYELHMPQLQERARIYVLDIQLEGESFKDEVVKARLFYNDQSLSLAVVHVRNANQIWQAAQTNEAMMVLMDMHLETTLNIELLSRRYARGEDKLFHLPSPWSSDEAEKSPLSAQDSAPQFVPLQRAIMLWEQATLAAQQNQYDDAVRLLSESQRYLQTYAGVSFNSYHTVQLNVQRRESLWRIAEMVYGDGFQWTRLWDANQDILTNPNRIYPGQQLGLPGGQEPSFEHAKPADSALADDEIDYSMYSSDDEENLEMEIYIFISEDGDDTDEIMIEDLSDVDNIDIP